MSADPKPPLRLVDPNAGKEKLLQERTCRACQRVGVWKLSRAHLVPKGQGGDDVDANIVPLCGGGTDGCHGALTDHHPATEPSLLKGQPWVVVAFALRIRLKDAERDYILAKKGLDWLDRTYPR